MNKSESVTELFKALSKFQGDLEKCGQKIRQGMGINTQLLALVLMKLKPALAANGLSVIQLVGCGDNGEPTMETVLGHSSGEYISTTIQMPIAKLQGGGGWQSFTGNGRKYYLHETLPIRSHSWPSSRRHRRSAKSKG